MDARRFSTSGFWRGFLLLAFLFAGLFFSACSVLDQIGERPEATQAPALFRTATPGGRISVWLITPTGRAAVPFSTPDPAQPRGEVIGPAGTATAVIGTLIAATQTAAAPASLPNFQPDQCPEFSGRVPEPRPDIFGEFPAAIGAFLSEGGAPAVLEGELRNWGAITGAGGVVQSDTDLTGDKIPEILITLYNPYAYNPNIVLNPGRLLVYGCDEGAYRLVYSTPDSPGFALPVLHRVGDMNGDVKAELVYDIQSCAQTYCTREGQILTWNPITGVFEPLNNAPIVAVNGRLGVADIDSDGILELTAQSNPLGDTASGPTRSLVDVWDWTGKNYVLAITQQDEPRYLIHAIHDADALLQQSSWDSALAGYRRARDNTNLLTWVIPGEREALRAFAAYRMVTVYARKRDTRNMQAVASTLITENPDGTAGTVYRDMAQAFVNDYLLNNNITTACQAALAISSIRSESVTLLNSFGYANRTYSTINLCPF